MNMTIRAGTFLCGILVSSLVMAGCPNTMPVKLLEDCIVYENAGHSFPPSDYVYMAMYKDWLIEQQPIAMSAPESK